MIKEEDFSDSVRLRASIFTMEMFDKSQGTAEDIRDAICKAIMDERGRSAQVAANNPTIKGKRISKLINGTSRR
jgi:hypothetical protein